MFIFKAINIITTLTRIIFGVVVPHTKTILQNLNVKIKMKFRKRYIIIICCLLGLIVLTRTCNKTSHILPSKYKISTEEKFSTGVSYGRILKVKSPIEIKDLKDYPKDYKKNLIRTEEKTLVHWTALDSLNDKEGIVATVRQILDFGDYEQVDNLLSQIEDTNSVIYFSGLGNVMKGLNSEKHNFYQFMYFLNMKNNEIYELDDIH